MKKYKEGGVYTAEMGKPPQDIDGASVTKAPKKPPAPKPPAPKKPEPKGLRGGVWTEDSGLPPPQDIDGASVKMAKGGVTRADGIAQRGKTRGKMC
jgi:hypothetical protein